MSDDSAQIKKRRQDRKKLKAQYTSIYSKILEILHRNDPIGICFGDDERSCHEYEPEVGTLLPRLKFAESVVDVHSIVYEEFVRWFGKSAGEKDTYRQTAEEIWEMWAQKDIPALGQ